MFIYIPSLEYYVYAYLRKDGSPYYIGKGKDKRLLSNNRKIKKPKDSSRIVICESNLTDVGALALERRLIRWYGRKDNGTGILRNMTDGGDGTSGGLKSPQHRKKLSESHTGKTLSEEHRKKISDRKMGKKQPGRSAIWNIKIGLANKNNTNGRNKQKWELTNPEGVIYVTNDIFEFCKDNNLNRECIRKVAFNIENRKHHKGWKAKIIF